MISFAGEAFDAEDGTLSPSAFSSLNNVMKGSFTIPIEGEVSANVWYRLYLTVTDSGGLTYTSYRDIYPQKVV